MTVTPLPDALRGAFAPPGAVALSPAALSLARAFREEILARLPDRDWIVSFDWADSRRMRKTNSNDWSDLGAGLDLAVYERRDLPANMIHSAGGFDYTVKIPSDVWQARRERRIDASRDTAPVLLLF